MGLHDALRAGGAGLAEMAGVGVGEGVADADLDRTTLRETPDG